MERERRQMEKSADFKHLHVVWILVFLCFSLEYIEILQYINIYVYFMVSFVAVQMY